MTASVPIPAEGELQLGAVRLPAGRILRTEGETDEPVAWITETAVPEPGPMWSALSALHGQTGLTDVADVDRADAAAMLEHLWTDSMPEPWQTGPEWAEEWEWAEEITAPFPASRIALVPAGRPADVLPVLGWIPGNWNCAFPAPSPVGFAAVLRSWEERFGARLFVLSHDQAWLLVERPPRDLDAALPVAAEHFVFCDEPAGRQPVRTTATDIAGAPVWYFWWD